MAKAFIFLPILQKMLKILCSIAGRTIISLLINYRQDSPQDVL